MKVSIVMGSKSDLDLAKAAGEILETLDVPYTINILSAHRTPELLHAHIDEAIADGVRVFIGIAGLAAHLAGNVASKTTLPVIGVPRHTNYWQSGFGGNISCQVGSQTCNADKNSHSICYGLIYMSMQ